MDDGYAQVDKVLKDLEDALLNKYNPNDESVAKRHPGEVSDSPFKAKIEAAKRCVCFIFFALNSLTLI